MNWACYKILYEIFMSSCNINYFYLYFDKNNQLKFKIYLNNDLTLNYVILPEYKLDYILKYH